MKYLQYIEKNRADLMHAIGRVADKKKIRAFAVGGLVRDCLLKRRNLDLDIAIEGNGIVFAKTVAGILKAKVVNHPPFGTAVLTLPDGLSIDIVTARREIYAKPGALPVVERSDLGDDLFRRDFTINAMAISINKESFGVLHDPYGGLNDIKEGLLRILHQHSFIDDPTRLLRLYRYAARLNFKIEPETKGLVKKAIEGRVWNTVKPQRYFHELRKLLNEPLNKQAVLMLQEDGLLAMPVLALRLTPRRYRTISDVLVLASEDKTIEPAILWLMGLHDHVREDDLEFSLSHLGLSRADSDAVLATLSIDSFIGALSVKHVKSSQVYLRAHGLDHRVLLMAMARAKGVALERLKTFYQYDRFIKLDIDGDDIKKMGVKEGVAVKKILNNVLGVMVDDGVLTRKGQLELARALVR